MWEKELHEMINAALLARDVIMSIYESGELGTEIKDDNSPVTKADKAADALIRKYLHEKFPTYAFLTEESEDNQARLENDYVFIVDPVDGTKDFLAHNGEFTTNIGLAYKHEVVAGVVSIPASKEIYYASKGNGSFYKAPDRCPEKISANKKREDLTVFCSNFHTNDKELALIEKHKDVIKHIRSVGSSIKACLIAKGEGELSYRMSAGTKEWDTAAMQIILEEAGAVILEPSGEKIKYNRKDVYNRNGYIVANLKENILL